MKTIKAVAMTVASFFLGIAMMPIVPFMLAYWSWQDRFYYKGLDKDDDDDEADEESDANACDLHSDKC